MEEQQGKKKNIVFIIYIILVALVLILTAAYYIHKWKLKKDNPQEDLVIEEGEVPTPATQYINKDELAKALEPEYTDLETDSEGLYPTLSGVYEPIWDGYESVPMTMLAKGTTDTAASYKIIWSKKYIYIQVVVTDYSKDTSGPDYSNQDSVEVFLNEDGQKNAVLAVGDSHYIVNRDNQRTAGFGADENFKSVVYEMPNITNEAGEPQPTGYFVEMQIPLLTIKASKNSSVGFEVRVNNASGGENTTVVNWASPYLYTFQNYSALGTLTFK